MHKNIRIDKSFCLAGLTALTLALSSGVAGAAERIDPATDKPKADLSGRARTGIASFYAKFFGGRTMADGTPMDLQGNNAASRTLPLGTTARVTNLETGQSATVTIRDRGPYVKGRIVDLSPATARQIGISKGQGLAKVEVAPLRVPLPDGTHRIGEGGEQVAAAGADPSSRSE
jgi:rare lipoprotein A